MDGNARLLLTDGSIVTARELFKKVEKSEKLFEKKEEHTIYDTRKSGLKVFSLNKKTGKLEKKPIELAWKLKGGELIHVILRNRYKISTTPEHKFLVCKDFNFVEKEAQDLALGDRVICSRRTEIKSKINIKEEILLRLAKKRFYIRFNDKFGDNIKKTILLNDFKAVAKKIGTKIKPECFRHGAWKKRYLVRDIIEVAKLFDITLEEIYDNIETVVYREGGWRGKNSLSMKLPTNFEDFFYLAGLFIGDGHENKFIVGKTGLGNELVRICKSFGITNTFRNYSPRTPEITTSQTVWEVFNSLFDYPKKRKSHNVKISDFVLQSPKKYAAKLLRGYFDTDGCVEKSRRAITLSSASDQMIEDLGLFLPRFGCIPKIEKDNTIAISGISAQNFVKEIGFGLEEKSVKAEQLVATMQGSFIADYIPITVMQGNETIQKQVRVSETNRIANLCKNYDISPEQMNKMLNEDIAYVEVTSLSIHEEKEVYDFTIPDNHNFVAEGMIIHNTTFSDSLLAGAGMISEELAGKQLALDFHADEQERGITIDSANVSMVHKVDDQDYLINMIDTPGHVDFGGDVTRAMRAVDGCIVLCDAVEGIMPQTETVLRQALKERVKPTLFINKVDRLIREVKLTPEEMQQRFIKIINAVNEFINKIIPEEFKDKWNVNVQEGSVAFGSAFHKWALSFPYMQKNNLSFKNIIDHYKQEGEEYKKLAKFAPLHQVVLRMVIKHLPNPVTAQKYRVPKIWSGDPDSPEGMAFMSCDPDGEVGFICTKIVIDPHAGEVAAGRLYSGTIRQGQEVYMNQAKKSVRVQQINIYKGAQRIQVEEAVAGNIVGLVGLKGAFAGETVSTNPIEPFEALTHIFEPVVTKSIEAEKASDLPKLVEVLRQVAKEDPTIQIEINEETGENLMHGMGELHLEVIENRIKTEKGVRVKTSPPIVVYRETVTKKSAIIEGKSPNKHNKFYITVEPMEDTLNQAVKEGKIPEGRIKKKDQSLYQELEKIGIPVKEGKKIREVFKGNVLIDDTRGIVHIGEVQEMVNDAFEQVMKEGPLAREPGVRMVVRLDDTKLHEDAIHRGPAQVYPAVRSAIKQAMMGAGAVIYEPVQVLQIEAPAEFMGEISRLVQNKRGQLIDMQQEGEHITIKAKLPVAEMFGLTNDLRSATSGRGNHFLVDQMFEKLPMELQQKVIRQIRDRKGLKQEDLTEGTEE